ncbi:hypothetical protein SAMN06265795_102296 [Noviherbaspirillum humi]|uniref:Uncharacterized protein n=1 Tax=Noviherbaspirillum humi TaxID=1688639 RepID=A0A239DRJ5_9BURK|nr:hypothetical protein [Noviherbaspirillum humi]SNS34194.1 hypothetical protein SAMN06265795_102296 [Noviherbaspirillum humi]
MTNNPNKRSPKKEDSRAANPNTLQVTQREGETEGRAHSRMMASPTVNAAVTMFNFHPMKAGANITDLVDELGKQVLTIRGDCMDRPEAMLAAQAHALDAMFTCLAQKAAANMNAGYLPASETYLRMALKAQSQCRTTLEALSEIKYPRSPTFIKQQNVAQQQQVNNGPMNSASSTRTHEKDINPTNEILEVSNGKRLDSGATSSTGSINQELATMGTGDRTQDKIRESS